MKWSLPKSSRACGGKFESKTCNRQVDCKRRQLQFYQSNLLLTNVKDLMFSLVTQGPILSRADNFYYYRHSKLQMAIDTLEFSSLHTSNLIKYKYIDSL